MSCARKKSLVSSQLSKLSKKDEIQNAFDALLSLLSLYSKEEEFWKIPKLVFQHQLYSILENRTLVDKQIEDLRKDSKIMLFKLRPDLNEMSIMFTEDYISHIKQCSQLSASIDSFIELIINKCPAICYSREQLKLQGLSEEDIVSLVGLGVLAIREAGSWWLSIPNSGIFFKHLEKGRRLFMSIIKKMKYKEILLQELEQRPYKKLVLGFTYHYHDLVGSNIIKRVKTTSGMLLRL